MFGSEELLNLLLVVFFLIVPILRGILSAREKQAQGQRSAPERREKERAAREVWERLLRGDVDALEEQPRTGAPAPPMPPPAAAAKPPAEAALPVEGTKLPPLAKEAVPWLRDIPSEAELEGGVSSHEPVVQGPLVKTARFTKDLPIRLGEDQLQRLDAESPWNAPMDPRDLRHAVVMAEVLGPPLALRPWNAQAQGAHA